MTVIVRDLDISEEKEDIVESIQKEVGREMQPKITMCENINRAGC